MSCVPLFSDSVWANCGGFTGKDDHELCELSKQRTEKFDDEYVRQVCQIWNAAKARPPRVKIESHWTVTGKTVACRSLAHEYYFTLLHWVLKEGTSLNLACRVVQWKMLPCAKLVRTSPVFLLSEPGCRQLLCFTLVRLMASLVVKSEALGSTKDNFCGMIQWIQEQCHLLVRLGSPFAAEARQIKLQMHGLLLLYVQPDTTDHGIALAMEAMNVFTALKDPARYEKAKARVPPTSALVPTAKHRAIAPIGPSSLASLNKREIL